MKTKKWPQSLQQSVRPTDVIQCVCWQSTFKGLLSVREAHKSDKSCLLHGVVLIEKIIRTVRKKKY